MSVIPNDNPNSNQIDYPMSKENKLQDLNENNNPKSLIMTEDNSDILMSNDDNKAIFEMISYENINSNNNGSILMNEPNSNNPDQFNNGDAHIGIIGDDLNNCWFEIGLSFFIYNAERERESYQWDYKQRHFKFFSKFCKKLLK